MEDFDLMRQVVDRIEAAIEALTKQYEQGVIQRGKGLEDDELQEHYNDSAGESMLLDGPVTEYARKAMLIAGYSHFEDSLKQLCRLAHADGLNSAALPRDLAIKRAKEYLSNAQNACETFNPAVFGDDWNEVYDGWRVVRNCLVHDDGLIGPNLYTQDSTGAYVPLGDPSRDAEKIKTFVGKRSDLELSGETIKLHRDAVPAFLRVAEAAYGAIERELARIAPPKPKGRVR